MAQTQQSVLIKTSAASDVQSSGGILTIAGLPSIRKSRISSLVQVKSKTEVVQVIKVGGTAYTPTASTKYTVLIGDPKRMRNGVQEQLKAYSYTTHSPITVDGVDAATQRETIHAALVSLINADTKNYVLATSLGTGTGFTVADDAGYYPVFNNAGSSRLGASTVLPATNRDGTGFAASNVSTTTAAVYSSGIGADLLASYPVIDAMTGGLLSGYLGTSATGTPWKTVANANAVSGQNYDFFCVVSLNDTAAFGGSGRNTALIPTVSLVAVDNGTGTSTTNLTGFIAFEREIRRVVGQLYKSDPSTAVEFFDQNFSIQGPLGAAPATTTSVINKFQTPYGILNHINIGTQTIVAPTQGANGLLLEQDVTATEGAHYAVGVETVNPQQFVVGKQAITFTFKFSCTTVANIVPIAGLRTKAAFTLLFDDYTNMAAVGLGAAGTTVTTYGILANAATVATASAITAVTLTPVDIRIVVALNGAVTAYANGTKLNIYSAGTTPLVFAADTILVPFFQYTNLNSAAAVPNVTEFMALPSDNVVI